VLYIVSVASLQENIFEGDKGFKIGAFLTVLTSLVVGSTLFLCFAEKEGSERFVEVVAVRAFKRPKQSKTSRETAWAVTTRLHTLTSGSEADRENYQNKEEVEMTSSLSLAHPETIDDPTFDEMHLSGGAEERLGVSINERLAMNPLATAKQEQRSQSLDPATTAAAFEVDHGEEKRGEAKSSLKEAQQGGVEERGAPPIVTSTNIAPISVVK